MKIYCRKCGNPTEYTAKYPSFCSGCGKPLNASAARMGRPPVEEPEEADKPQEETPTISKLDLDIQLYDKNPLTIGDIAGSKNLRRRSQGKGKYLSQHTKIVWRK